MNRTLAYANIKLRRLPFSYLVAALAAVVTAGSLLTAARYSIVEGLTSLGITKSSREVVLLGIGMQLVLAVAVQTAILEALTRAAHIGAGYAVALSVMATAALGEHVAMSIVANLLVALASCGCYLIFRHNGVATACSMSALPYLAYRVLRLALASVSLEDAYIYTHSIINNLL